MKLRTQTMHLLSLAVAVVLLAAACGPAAAPVPPTNPPTDAPATATAMPPTLAPTLAPPTVSAATATAVPPTTEPTPDLLVQVAAFQAAYDQQDIDGVMAVFGDDPSWSLLLGPLTGYASAASIRALHNTLEFQYEFNMKLEATDCSATADHVACVLLIKDDCTPPAVDAYHFHTQFTFEDGKLTTVYGRWDESDQQAFSAVDAARQEWARENSPEDAAAYSSASFEGSADFGEWGKFIGIGEMGTGTLSAAEFGQAVERICTGYAAAAP